MLHFLFPKTHHRFRSLPLLGSIADSFDDWLASNGYTQVSRKNSIRTLPRVDAELRRRQIREICNLNLLVLDDCWRASSRVPRLPEPCGQWNDFWPQRA